MAPKAERGRARFTSTAKPQSVNGVPCWGRAIITSSKDRAAALMSKKRGVLGQRSVVECSARLMLHADLGQPLRPGLSVRLKCTLQSSPRAAPTRGSGALLATYVTLTPSCIIGTSTPELKSTAYRERTRAMASAICSSAEGHERRRPTAASALRPCVRKMPVWKTAPDSNCEPRVGGIRK
jgi:hypothetical protein